MKSSVKYFIEKGSYLSSLEYLEPHCKLSEDLAGPYMSYRFAFQKRNLHLPYGFTVKNKFDKIFKAATDIKNNSPE